MQGYADGNLIMIFYVTEARIRAVLERAVSHHHYPLIVGGIAFALTVSMMVPFASVLIPAVLLCRKRWKLIAILSSAGSALGGLTLYLIFHHLGWNQIIASYPDLAQSKGWADATRWLSVYGTPALLVISASPLPQTPALIFTAIYRLPVIEVFFALFIGKLLKYGVYAWLASRFPARFQFGGDAEALR